MPEILQWSEEQEKALALTPEECHLFGTHHKTGHALNLHAKPPTLLHSLGSLLDPCPCGCRPWGLSLQRLHSRGISGLIVQTTHGWRHIHPAEAALLQGTTLPAALLQTLTPADYKLLLTQLGQLASTLHAGVFAQQIGALLNNLPTPLELRRKLTQPIMNGWRTACVILGARFETGTTSPPVSWLEIWLDPNRETLIRGNPTATSYHPYDRPVRSNTPEPIEDALPPSPPLQAPPRELQDQLEHTMPTQPMAKQGLYLTRLLPDTPAHTSWLWIDQQSTVQDLLHAEQLLAGPTYRVTTLRAATGDIVDLDARLDPMGRYQLEAEPATFDKPDPVVVVARCHNKEHTVCLPPGSRLFDLTHKLCLPQDTEWTSTTHQWTPPDILLQPGHTFVAQEPTQGDIPLYIALGGMDTDPESTTSRSRSPPPHTRVELRPATAANEERAPKRTQEATPYLHPSRARTFNRSPE